MEINSEIEVSEMTFVQKKGQQFKQQRLPAVIIHFSIKCISPIIIGMSLFFLIFGIIMITAIHVNEVTVNYDECSPTINVPENTCEEYLKRAANNISLPLCTCVVSFTLAKAINKQVYIYYRIEEFYQNYRTFANSIDFKQLSGSLGTPSSDCEPYRSMTQNGETHSYAPCGTNANSMYNDTVSLSFNGSSVPLLRQGISNPYDKRSRYKNPKTWDGTVKPPSWRMTVMELDISNPNNNGYENEDFIVWMRPGAFPSPLKLYRLVDHADYRFKNGLPAGEYKLHIKYNFPVHVIDGRKAIIISNPNWVGTNSMFLPIAYIIVSIVSTIALIIIAILSKKKTI